MTHVQDEAWRHARDEKIRAFKQANQLRTELRQRNERVAILETELHNAQRKVQTLTSLANTLHKQNKLLQSTQRDMQEETLILAQINKQLLAELEEARQQIVELSDRLAHDSTSTGTPMDIRTPLTPYHS
jgi:chromosome segregation ATPase